jgi:ribosome-associated protein
MDETNVLVQAIVDALQEKKGKKIVLLDLSGLDCAICQYFIVVQGNTPTQVSALSDEVWDRVADHLHEKPLGAVGMQEAQWIAMDYGTVMLHVFIPSMRDYYNLEGLWADATVTEIPDVL